MKVFSIGLILVSSHLHLVKSSPENGNLISEPVLADYSQASRAPGILGVPEDVQDENGTPASL